LSLLFLLLNNKNPIVLEKRDTTMATTVATLLLHIDLPPVVPSGLRPLFQRSSNVVLDPPPCRSPYNNPTYHHLPLQPIERWRTT
jgi:hypothetical protein